MLEKHGLSNIKICKLQQTLNTDLKYLLIVPLYMYFKYCDIITDAYSSFHYMSIVSPVKTVSSKHVTRGLSWDEHIYLQQPQFQSWVGVGRE